MRRFAPAVLAPVLFGLAAALAPAAPAGAQAGRFVPRIEVNDGVITDYEIDQRMAFEGAINAPVASGGPEAGAIDSLIDDRIRMQAARRLGVVPTDAEIRDAMAEFAGRADLELSEFLDEMAQEGVAEATVRDFVEARIAWREVVQTRFGPRARITESEVDRALALGGGRGGARVRLAEIVLPAQSPQQQAQADKLAGRLARSIDTEAAFSQAARRYSAAPSRARGGVSGWRALAQLPPQLARSIITLAPGETTEPIQLDNAVALFQNRGLQEVGGTTPEAQSLDYARYLVAGGRDAARQVAGRVDTCDDLYGVARGEPAERLTRRVQPADEVPARIAAELERLDADEISTRLSSGETGVVLMLCARTTAAAADADRGDIRSRLRNQRLSSYADGYLAELRADAIIRRR